MDKEISEQFQMLANMMEKMQASLQAEIKETKSSLQAEIKETKVGLQSEINDNKQEILTLAGMMEKMQARINDNRQEILKTQIMIENNVTKKISSLFDGYKLTHEKQFELEQRMTRLERTIADLQSRIA